MILSVNIFLFKTAQRTDAGVVPNVKVGYGMYRKFPIGEKNTFTTAPFKYDLTYSRHSSEWVFNLQIDDDLKKMNISKVEMYLRRPVTNVDDQYIVMQKNSKKAGLYKAFVRCALGQWDLEILVVLKDQSYIIRKKVLLTMRDQDE